MTLTLELPPEREARLRQKAEAQGLAVEEFAVETLMQATEEQTLAEALMGLIGVVDSSEHSGGSMSHTAENSGEVFSQILLEKHKAGFL